MAAVVGSLLAEVAVDKSGLTAGLRAAGVDLTNFENRSTRQFQRVEGGFNKIGKSATALGGTLRLSLLPSLGAISGALSVAAVASYASAWTDAKNALAVAGIVGQQQTKVLDALYNAAQKNAAPLNALADLYARASQAADVLGASQEQLLKFSGGIATALRVAGVSASQASGALTQLSQLLASGTVRAEEFNSVNEQARPILQAVAAGMERTGGSVAKLRNLVASGKVSSKEFFDSFLAGLPKIEAMAANSTDTIAQAVTRVENAFEKFIGSTDESLGASARLTQGLTALADNFDTTANFALQLASVIAGALVGRSIVGMISKVWLARDAWIAFGRAIAAARTISMASALGSLGAAAGPLGAIIGGVLVGSLVLFSSRADDASKGAKSYAQALKIVQDAANKAAEAVDNASGKIDEQEKNSLTAGVKTGTGEIEASRQAAVDLIEKMIEAGQTLTIVRDETGKMSRQPLATPEQLAQLNGLRDGLKAGSIEAAAVKDALFAMANSNPKFQKMADQMAPLLDALRDAVAATSLLKNRLGNLGSGPNFRQVENDSMAAYQAMKAAGDKFVADAQKRNALSKDELALENEIAKVKMEAEKAGIVLSEKRIEALAAENLAAEKRRSDEGRDTSREGSRLTA